MQGRHANCIFDVIFSGDILNSYKPNAAMYLGACEKLSLKPEEVLMCAAHIEDLEAAASFGVGAIWSLFEHAANTLTVAQDMLHPS